MSKEGRRKVNRDYGIMGQGECSKKHKYSQQGYEEVFFCYTPIHATNNTYYCMLNIECRSCTNKEQP